MSGTAEAAAAQGELKQSFSVFSGEGGTKGDFTIFPDGKGRSVNPWQCPLLVTAGVWRQDLALPPVPGIYC